MSTLAVVMGALGGAVGLGLAGLARRAEDGADALVAQVDALLPQTQCAQCGYPGCRPYAEAVVAGEVPIDRCPPGGDVTVEALSRLLGDEARGVDPTLPRPVPGIVAVIDEQRCIGCALCLPACPVDAIVGAHRFMHTVIESECTGCELCLPPCPVDCIELRQP